MSRTKNRCLLALNGLFRLFENDRFIQHPVRQKENERTYNVLHHLQSISIMLSGGTLYRNKDILKAAQETAYSIRNWEFEVPHGLAIVFQGKSLITWDAMAAVIYFKLGDHVRATKYINNIKSCVSENSIKASCLHPIQDGTPVDLGVILLSLIMAYQFNRDTLDVAKVVGNKICGTPMQFSGYDAWGLKFLSVCSELEFYTKRQRLMSQSISSISIPAMTSLFAAVAQQVLLSEGQGRKDFLKQQLSLQITPDNISKFTGFEKYVGLFIRKTSYPEIRIDYTIQNIASMLQYDISSIWAVI